MMIRKTRILYAGVIALGLSGAAQATLFDRGGGMIYDSDQDITWLQDANYAVTSGYAAANSVNNGSSAWDNIFTDGRMGWDAATAWAGGLSYGGYDDWRLPTVTDNGNDGCNFSYSGTECGYNVDTATGELAYMWYNILSNTAFFDTSGSGPQSGWGLTSTGADGVNFVNLQSSAAYWSGTEYALYTGYGWIFGADNGIQHYGSKYTEYYAWAVRSGDVGDGVTVPEPGTFLLMGAGLIGLLGRCRSIIG